MYHERYHTTKIVYQVNHIGLFWKVVVLEISLFRPLHTGLEIFTDVETRTIWYVDFVGLYDLLTVLISTST